MTADILEFRPRHMVERRPARAERTPGLESSLLETWPMRAIAAVWTVGMLAMAAGFVSVMWWVTA